MMITKWSGEGKQKVKEPINHDLTTCKGTLFYASVISIRYTPYTHMSGFQNAQNNLAQKMDNVIHRANCYLVEM